MATAYFAYGTTLAGLTNFETVMSTPFHVIPDGVIPLAPKADGNVLSQKSDRSSTIVVQLSMDIALRSEFNAMIYAVFGGFTGGDVERYITAIDEEGYYSPFLATLKKPDAGNDYRNINQSWLGDLRLTVRAPVLQSVTKTSNATLTSSERLVYGDTTGGNVTLTLPAASAVQPHTVVSVQKIAAGNTLSVQRGGSDTLNGGTSAITLTTNHSRYDIVSDGVSAWITL